MTIQEANARTTALMPQFDVLVVPGDEAASYIEKMCVELAGLADRSGLGFLAYLLEVAREEAVLHAAEMTATQVHGELPPR